MSDLEYFINLTRPKTIADIVNQHFYLHLNLFDEENQYHGGLYLKQNPASSLKQRLILFPFDTKARNRRQALHQINQWVKTQKVPLFYQSLLNIPENAFQFIQPLPYPKRHKLNHLNSQHIRE